MSQQNTSRSPGDIAQSVRLAIKRDGTFDAVRKRALADVCSTDGFINELRIEGKEFCDGLFQSVFDKNIDVEMDKSLKESMMNKIKEHANRPEIHDRIKKTIDQQITVQWVQRALEESVEDKVRVALGLPPLQRFVPEETDSEEPSSKDDTVIKEEPLDDVVKEEPPEEEAM